MLPSSSGLGRQPPQAGNGGSNPSGSAIYTNGFAPMNPADFDLIAYRLKEANRRAIYPAQRACLYDLMNDLSQQFATYFSYFNPARFHELTGFSQDMLTFNRQQAHMEHPPEPPIGGSPSRGRPPPPINWAEIVA